MAKYPTEHEEPWLDEHGFLRVRTGSQHRIRAGVEADPANPPGQAFENEAAAIAWLQALKP